MAVTIAGNTQNLNGIKTESSPTDPYKQGQYYEGFVSNVGSQAPTMIQWDFATPLAGWGATFGQANNTGSEANLGGLGITVNGQTFDLDDNYLGDSSTDSDNGFIGVVDTMATFSEVKFQLVSTATGGPSAAEYFTIDNVVVSGAVPEPAALLGVFMASIFLIWKKRR